MILLYIDPGIGFLALQMLSVSFLGIVFVFRRTLWNITAYLRTHLHLGKRASD